MLADTALQVAGSSGIGAGLGAYGGQLFMFRFVQGRVDELADFFLETVAAMPTIEPLRVAVLVMLVELGDVAGAAERFVQERAHGFGTPCGEGQLSVLLDLADVAVDLGDVDAAGELLEHIAPFGTRMSFVSAIAPRAAARSVGRLCGLLGRTDEAEEAFTLSLSLDGRFDNVYWLGRTHVERAEMYARRGDPGDLERVEHDLEAALEYAARCGGVVDRAACRPCPCRRRLTRRLCVLHRVA